MQRTILTASEVADMTGVPVPTLKYWRDTTSTIGRGPRWYKLEGRVRYDLSDVQAWIQGQRAASQIGGDAA